MINELLIIAYFVIVNIAVLLDVRDLPLVSWKRFMQAGLIAIGLEVAKHVK